MTALEHGRQYLAFGTAITAAAPSLAAEIFQRNPSAEAFAGEVARWTSSPH